MFNTHTPQLTMIVSNLPQMYQDSCAEILDKQMPGGPSGESPLKPSSGPMKPRTVGSTLNTARPRTSPHRALDPDDSENLNPEDVNKSLRLTANAIQNYSFDRMDKICDISMPNCDLADEKDSGISQVSADGLGPGGLEDKLAMLELQVILASHWSIFLVLASHWSTLLILCSHWSGWTGGRAWDRRTGGQWERPGTSGHG